MQAIKSLPNLFLSFLFALALVACSGEDSGGSMSSDGSSSSTPGSSSGLSHDVVYEEEIYKHWPN